MPARLELPSGHPHVALVTIDRPERANSLDPPTLRELAEAWRRVQRWQVEHPDSTRLARALAEAREERRNASLLDDLTLARIARLYTGGPSGPDKRPALARARAVTERFLRYYHHAVPFDRAVLVRAWRECRLPACREARRRAEEQLGPLDGIFGALLSSEAALVAGPGLPFGLSLFAVAQKPPADV